MKTTIRQRLEQDLLTARTRLHQLGRVVALDELPDPLDRSQSTTSGEIILTTRELLLERVHGLSDALDRLRDGAYGVCVECHEPLAPARLRAMPAVQTCVRCQSGLERVDRQISRSRERLLSVIGTE